MGRATRNRAIRLVARSRANALPTFATACVKGETMRVFDHEFSDSILVYKSPPTQVSIAKIGKYFGVILPVDENDLAGEKIIMGLYREEKTATEQIGRFKKFCADGSNGDFFFEKEPLPAITALEFARSLSR